MTDKEKKIQLLEINKEAAKLFYKTLFLPEGKKGLEYFKKRQLSDETIKNFGLGFSNKSGKDMYSFLSSKGFSDEILKESGIITYDEETGWKNKFWNRAMFSIKNINGEIIAFGGRVLDDSKPKYLNSPETIVFDKSNNLYALEKAENTSKPYFILCEGYMDTIALHQAGFDCAIAALGTAFTNNHATIISKYTNKIFLTFDSDRPGIEAALRAIPICKKAGIDCKVINMKPYKDPDEFIKALGSEEFEKRIKEAKDNFLFEMFANASKTDMNDLDAKISFYKYVAEKMCNLDDKKIEEILK